MVYKLNLLIDNKPADVYSHEGNFYIEGRKDKQYEIQLINDTGYEAEFVVSIDGLSIIDGKAASSKSTGYIIRPYNSSIVRGWLVDEATAAAFKFGGKDKSYVEAIGADSNNVGVIGLKVFKKKQPKPVYGHNSNYPWHTGRGILRQTFGSGSVTSNTFGSPQNNTAYQNNSWQGSGAEAYADAGSTDTKNLSQELGTEFGEATQFATTKVNFERASEIPVFERAFYYDSAKNLNALGIQMVWQRKPAPTKPQAFPGDYCKTPDAWSKNVME